MTVSTGSTVKALFSAARAQGEKAINSDAYLEVVGNEALGMLCKQFPWPILTTAGEIEVPMPMGTASWQAQNLKPNQQGGITFMETVDGQVGQFIKAINEQGGYFDAVVYEGTPDKHTRKEKLYSCFLQCDPVDRDWENRGQIVLITGTLFYHYFGDE